MLKFNNNPKIANKQMQGIIFYLTSFGYIDGDFDQVEREFVLNYIKKLVSGRVENALGEDKSELKQELILKYVAHFEEEFNKIDNYIQDIFNETTAKDEDQHTFVLSRLKLRCFEIFKSFDSEGQEALMEMVDELLMADGVAHPSEVRFRAELSELLEEELGVELLETGNLIPLNVKEVEDPDYQIADDPFLASYEYHYSNQPKVLMDQLNNDVQLLRKTMDLFNEQRAKGAGKLKGKSKVSEFEGEEQFLDGHVYVVPIKENKTYEITVLGDLHGAYSCLKAALIQSDFLKKVEAYKKDPVNNPDPKLVF
jgi:hypothetical protein